MSVKIYKLNSKKSYQVTQNTIITPCTAKCKHAAGASRIKLLKKGRPRRIRYMFWILSDKYVYCEFKKRYIKTNTVCVQEENDNQSYTPINI